MKKFILKPGTRILCINTSASECYTAGKYYIVKKYNKETGIIYTELDNKGLKNNGYHQNNFFLKYFKQDHYPKWF